MYALSPYWVFSQTSGLAQARDMTYGVWLVVQYHVSLKPCT
jgi:hypothetical protein